MRVPLAELFGIPFITLKNQMHEPTRLDYSACHLTQMYLCGIHSHLLEAFLLFVIPVAFTLFLQC